jgi:hypothetical protein
LANGGSIGDDNQKGDRWERKKPDNKGRKGCC